MSSVAIIQSQWYLFYFFISFSQLPPTQSSTNHHGSTEPIHYCSSVCAQSHVIGWETVWEITC